MKRVLTGINCIAVGIFFALIFTTRFTSATALIVDLEHPVFSGHPFDALTLIKNEKRVDAAVHFYKTNFRHLPERKVMHYLDQLTVMARRLDDKPLESVVFDLKADYYAVNKLFNNKSINYYRQAVDFSKKNDLVLEEAIYLLHEGMFYYVHKHNNQACLSFLRSLEVFKKYGFDRVPNISFYLGQIADFYYHIGDYKSATAYLQLALKHRIENPRARATFVNTLGLIARNDHQYPEALGYFARALKLAKENNDTIWVSIVNGNIGSVYFMQGQYDRASPYIQADYQTSLKYDEKINAAIALLRLVKISLVKGETHKSLQQLNEAELLINTPVPDLNLRTELFDLKAQIYEQMGRYKQAVDLRKKYQLIKDSLNVQNNIAAVEVVRMQYVINKQQAAENRLKVQSKIRGIQRNAVFIVLFLVVVILILVYNRQKLKIRKDQELLKLEKQRLDEELEFTEMKLTAYTENLRKNNVLIESFKEQIEGLKDKKADSAVVRHLEELMQAHIMTDESWMEFKKIFLKVYPNFFFDIKKRFLYLSETDLRLLTLIKLQSNNKEIANMLGITVEGVKKAKQRLRKKMQLNDDINIEEAISTL
jgi:tetratricopeptide (TPR) repeat protein